MLEAEQEVINCPRCGFEMMHMQACHMFCSNCGVHLDCSDKGGVW
jgi:ribosomal protein L37E